MWWDTLLDQVYIVFPVQLIISTSVFVWDRPRRERFPFRLCGSLISYFLFSFLWHLLLTPFMTMEPLPYAFFYIGFALLLFIPVRFSFDLPPIEAGFFIVGGYATEHITYAALKILNYFTGASDAFGGLLQYPAYFVVAAVIYLLIIRPNRDKGDFKTGDVRIAVLATVLMISAIVLSVYYTAAGVTEGTTLLSEVICPMYSCICCVLVLTIEYYQLRENRMKRDQETMEQMLRIANAQQKISKETIDIINVKCHDLKHQIRALTKMQDDSARAEYIREIQDAISIYDTVFDTGCEALDYVLREKALIAGERHVTFTCMADGSAISFMRPMDVYALMGNALDNALERLSYEVEEQRFLRLQIKRRGQMVSIHLENRCSREPEFRDGLPVTEKEDKNFHGFGVKSIRYVAERYGGEVLMRVKNGTYALDILLPEMTSCT